MYKLSNIDKTIAEEYLAALTEPIKYGESAVFFWFPGSGMTTILRDVFGSKQLLNKSLQKLSTQLKITQFFGQLSEKKTVNSLINEAGFQNYSELKAQCEEQLKLGYEIVYIISRIDDYPSKERISILKTFLRLNAVNPRRVHILFNTMDKPWFMDTLNKYPELISLANRMKIMPVLSNKPLIKYIKVRATEYGYPINDSVMKSIILTCGGILQLTKETIRSHGDTFKLEPKLKLIWNAIPKIYQEILNQNMSGSLPKSNNYLVQDLKEFGVLDLKVFSNHSRILNVDSSKLLIKVLTKEELNLWHYMKNHQREFLSKDLVLDLLRPDSAEDISLWAIDKAISRFRKKLDKCGIDSSLFKTIKGKGYIWN